MSDNNVKKNYHALRNRNIIAQLRPEILAIGYAYNQFTIIDQNGEILIDMTVNGLKGNCSGMRDTGNGYYSAGEGTAFTIDELKKLISCVTHDPLYVVDNFEEIRSILPNTYVKRFDMRNITHVPIKDIVNKDGHYHQIGKHTAYSNAQAILVMFFLYIESFKESFKEITEEITEE